MGKVLLIVRSSEIKALVTDLLKTNLKCEFQTIDSAHDGMTILHKNVDYQLIICEDKLQKDTANLIYKYIIDKNLKIPFILIGNLELSSDRYFKDLYKDNSINANVNTPINPPLLTSYIASALDSNQKIDNEGLEDPRIIYKAVPIQEFQRLIVTEFDVFTQQDNQFHILFKKYSKINRKILKDLFKKNIGYLYIQNENWKKFYDKEPQKIIELLQNEELDPLEKIYLELDSYCSIQHQIKENGITQEIKNQISLTINSNIDHILKERNISKILKRTLNHIDYKSEHSLALSYFSCFLAFRLGWNSPSTYQKLAIASLFHDITLDDERLIKVNSLNISNHRFLNKKIAKSFKEHPMEAARLVRNLGIDLPNGTEIIIMQHHELPEGKGLPIGIHHFKIAPLSCLFIISEYVINRFFEIEFNYKHIDQIIKEVQATFNVGNFKQFIIPIAKLLRKF